MMTNAQLWSINHQAGTGIFGGVSKEFIIGDQCASMDPRHLDMRAPWFLYRAKKVAPIIGFQGYRKFMNFRDSIVRSGMAPGWEEVPLDRFLGYQHWLAEQDDGLFSSLLNKADILTVEPFNCSYNGGMDTDYIQSRSLEDWAVFEGAMRERGYEDFQTPYIRPMHFVMRDETFCQYMRFWENLMPALERKVKSNDARSPEAADRSLGFLSERAWSLWVENGVHDGSLRIRTFPLMICWDAK